MKKNIWGVLCNFLFLFFFSISIVSADIMPSPTLIEEAESKSSYAFDKEVCALVGGYAPSKRLGIGMGPFDTFECVLDIPEASCVQNIFLGFIPFDDGYCYIKDMKGYTQEVLGITYESRITILQKIKLFFIHNKISIVFVTTLVAIIFILFVVVFLVKLLYKLYLIKKEKVHDK